MSRIVIASVSEASRNQLARLLTSSGYAVFRLCASEGELRRTLTECEDGIVLVSGIQPDDVVADFGDSFQFLLIGGLLNIFRWLIPGILQAVTIHTSLIEDIDYCLQSDIYYFVGLFFIFYSFLKEWKIRTSGLLLISFIMLSFNTLITPITHKYVTNHIVASLLGNIVYVNETSCFPLLSWAIFPSVGILLGETLKSSTEEQRENIMRRMMDFSVVLAISFIVFLWDYKIDLLKTVVSPANDYITDLPNVILLLILSLVQAFY